MTDYTPGPWHASYKNCHVGQIATCHGDGEGWYEVWTTNWGDGVNQKANARLIAAAPCLLEALENAIDAYESFGRLNSREIQIALEAIAKAKGQENSDE